MRYAGVFFSASGVTAKVSDELTSVLNADLHEIVPQRPILLGWTKIVDQVWR